MLGKRVEGEVLGAAAVWARQEPFGALVGAVIDEKLTLELLAAFILAVYQFVWAVVGMVL